MNISELKQKASSGEDSRNQFKQDITNVDSLAAELVAFSNTDGGLIYIGVADNGDLIGLDHRNVARMNQLISNASSQHIRSPIVVVTENVPLENGRVVIVLSVSRGIDRPYFDKNGVIWLKSGADKRRINSKEELRRLFQEVDLIHADEVSVRASVDTLDKLRFREFLQNVYKLPFPDNEGELGRLLRNLNLAGDSDCLNLAGLLLFAEHPEWVKPVFIVKVASFPGREIGVNQYHDSDDFAGPFRKIFDDTMAFLMRNMHKLQYGQSVNSLGISEIPEPVFEELLVNALVHRDYFISAPIRIFVFDDRIEIISPGTLTNHLTVEKICNGNSNIRNPILASFVAKNMLPYRGLGSGIRRALEHWKRIEFVNDLEACTFTAIIRRPEKRRLDFEEPGRSTASTVMDGDEYGYSVERRPQRVVGSKTTETVLKLLKNNPSLTAAALGKSIGMTARTVEREIKKLKDSGFIVRIGPTRGMGGRWQVIDY